MVIGTIIGASIFVQPSHIAAAVPSITGVLVVWAAAGALTLIGSLVTAELASAYPRTGGVYVYLREGWSPLVAYLWGWAMFWSMHTGIIAVIATVFARYMSVLVPMGDTGIRVVAVSCVVVLSILNYIGVRQGSAVQTAATAVKLLATAAIVLAGVVWAVRTGGPPDAVGAARGGATVTGLLSALMAGLFAYGGWHMVTYAAEETKDPVRTIPRALLVGTLVVTVAYLLVNAAYLVALPLETVATSERVAADFAGVILGADGARGVAVLVAISTFGAVTGIILGGPRVYLAMADDGLLPRWFAAVHPRFRTPHRALVAQMVWASVLAATGTYRVLFTRVVYTEWIFFGLMAASLFVLRRRPDYAPTHRIWGYPITPAIFIAASAAIVLNQLVTDPAESAFGLLMVLAGIPVYYWMRRGGRSAA
jgi:APA family basic amino acid/polyamine antiporter